MANSTRSVFSTKKRRKQNLPPTPKADTPEEKHKNEEPDYISMLNISKWEKIYYLRGCNHS
jgi:hypothetical protein